MAASTVTIKDANGDDRVIATELNAGIHTFRHVIVTDDGSLVYDPTTETIMTVDFAHHEVHEGSSYTLEAVKTANGNNDYIGISFTTPAAAAGRIHLVVGYITKASAHLELIEVPQTLTNGTAVDPINRRRPSFATVSNLTDVKTYDSTGIDVITIGTGEVLHHLYTWVSKSIGSKNRDINEFILKANTSYAIKLTSDENTNAGQIIANFYQHIDS